MEVFGSSLRSTLVHNLDLAIQKFLDTYLAGLAAATASVQHIIMTMFLQHIYYWHNPPFET